MSILDSSIAPGIFLLAGVGVLAAFFRKLLFKVVIIVGVMVLFMALFPKVLLAFVTIVSRVSDVIR